MVNWKSCASYCLLAVVGLGYGLEAGAADVSGWYVGAGFGRSDAKKTTSWGQVADATLFGNGFTTSTLINSHDNAWKIFGGYQFNENVAVEGGYTDLGRFTGTTVITAPAAGTASGKWDASSPFNLSAVGIIPIKGGLSAFGKLGLAVTKLHASISPPTAASLSATRVQPLLGAGFMVDFTKTFAVRAEFERFNNVGDGSNTGQTSMNVWSVSGQYRF